EHEAEPQRCRPSRIAAMANEISAVGTKAMAPKPEICHGSGRALADDIERWMADEPVTAWKEPRARTLLRWLTRRRTAVTGTAAAVLVGVAGLVAVLAGPSAPPAGGAKANEGPAAPQKGPPRAQAAPAARDEPGAE